MSKRINFLDWRGTAFWEVFSLKHHSRRFSWVISVLVVVFFAGSFIPVSVKADEEKYISTSSKSVNADALANHKEESEAATSDKTSSAAKEPDQETGGPVDGGQGGTESSSSSKPDSSQGGNNSSSKPVSSAPAESANSSKEPASSQSNSSSSRPASSKPDVSSQTPDISKVNWAYRIKADGKDITNSFVRNGNTISGTVSNDISMIAVTATTNTVGAKVSVMPNGAVYLNEGYNGSAVKINLSYNNQTVTYTLAVTRQKAAGVVSEEESISSEPVSSEEVSSQEAVSSEEMSSEAVSSEALSSKKPIDSDLKDSNWMVWAAILLFVLGAGGIGYVIYDQFFRGKKKGPHDKNGGGGAKSEAAEEEEAYDIMNESGQQQEPEDDAVSELYGAPEEEEVKATEIQDDWGNYFK